MHDTAPTIRTVTKSNIRTFKRGAQTFFAVRDIATHLGKTSSNGTRQVLDLAGPSVTTEAVKNGTGRPPLFIDSKGLNAVAEALADADFSAFKKVLVGAAKAK